MLHAVGSQIQMNQKRNYSNGAYEQQESFMENGNKKGAYITIIRVS